MKLKQKQCYCYNQPMINNTRKLITPDNIFLCPQGQLKNINRYFST